MTDTTALVADTICRTVELGLTMTGAAIAENFTHIECRPVEHDPRCPSVCSRAVARPRRPDSDRSAGGGTPDPASA